MSIRRAHYRTRTVAANTCSVEYQAELRKNGISISMSGKETASKQRSHGRDAFFKTLKAELVWRTLFQSRIEAASAIGRYIGGFLQSRPPPFGRSTSSARFSSKGGQRKNRKRSPQMPGKSRLSFVQTQRGNDSSAQILFPMGEGAGRFGPPLGL